MSSQRDYRVGKMILLNTPIGNLGDMTKRVEDALRSGMLFAVEDTRVFKDLLSLLGISLTGKKILSLHDHTQKSQMLHLLELARSETLYVASEAGSPCISDPAYPLVVLAYENGFEVDSFSGVSSPIMALELSGLPPMPFTFHGFLPRENSKRKNLFLNASFGTHIFFEAPTRIEESMEELSSTLPEVDVVIVRELSKKFQQVIRFKAREWADKKNVIVFKGEFIFLFHQQSSQLHHYDLENLASEVLSSGGTLKSFAKLIAKILDRPTKEIYSILNRQKNND
jgi:16S rRNA (cytidine1402-2'-O)-methyltransferase